MKKFLILLTAVTIAGCSNISVPTSLVPATIGIASQEKIAAAVSKSELYAVGSSKIDTAGSFVAEGKARTQARENLKTKILNEVATIFNVYMQNVDANTKKVYTAALPDLRNYTTDTLLLKAVEKIALVDNDKSYVVLAVNKEEISKESKFVFTEYTSSVIKKLETVKTLVGKSNAGLPIEVIDDTPVSFSPKKENSENIKKDLPSIDEDPLFY
ncbi:hypothetical protein HUW86_01895 [Fusobacterium sp. SB021]|uniref:hypothetical protein n=1 Tax=Fusobacterium sp. SB021 TaxID=2744227 RepID=UPI003CFB00A7